MLRFATTPLAIKQVWREGFKLAHTRLLPAFFIYFFMQIILEVILFAQQNNTLVAAELYSLKTFAYWFILTIISNLLGMITTAIVLYFLGTLMQGKSFTFKESCFAACRKLPVLILAWILATLATVAGGLLLALPGLYIMIVMMFYFPTIILTDKPVIAAFKYTFSIVWGKWWRTVAVIILPFLGILLFNEIFNLLMQPRSQPVHLLETLRAMPIVRYSVAAFSEVFCAYLNVLLAAIYLIQWNDLRLRKQLKQSTLV